MVKANRKNNSRNISSSYRDPSGYLFSYDGILYRSVAPSYKLHYETLFTSGLYDELISSGYLIPHKEIDNKKFKNLYPNTYKIIQPESIPFISYPYEWSFSMLADAAMLTLEIQKRALAKGMILKDATAYNIQFYKGKPILIDTLSFEQYHEGRPWVAYRQFCEMFLSPLSLCAYVDERLIDLLRVYLDGVPLDLTSKLLPLRSRFSFSLLMHIFLHAKSQAELPASRQTRDEDKTGLTLRGLLGIIDNLESATKSLSLPLKKSTWSDYYAETNYSEKGMDHKKQVVDTLLQEIKPHVVYDMGANTGEFSFLSSKQGVQTIAMDFDYIVIEKLYRFIKKEAITTILPLRVDLSNPSPSIGWANQERTNLLERGKSDVLMALALVHHIAIAKNVPFSMISSYLSQLTKYLIIEFVPKEDSQVQKLLSQREDIFTTYTQAHFEDAFREHFIIQKKIPIKDTKRTLYLMNVP